MFLLAIVLCLFYSFACLCLGRYILRQIGIRLSSVHVLTDFASAFLMGQGILANLWIIVALFSWFNTPIIIGILTLSIVLGYKELQKHLLDLFERIKVFIQYLNSEKLVWKIIFVLPIVLLVIRVLGSQLPLQAGGDGEAFYMAISKAIASSHHIVALRGYESFSRIWFYGEMHFAALISLGSDGAAKLFVWLTAIALITMLLSIGSKVGLGGRGKLIALVTITTSTAILYLIGDGKVDLFAAAMGTAAFMWALNIEDERDYQVFRLIGIFAGIAITAKISYLVSFLPGILIMIGWRLALTLKKYDVSSSVKIILNHLFQFALLMLVMFIPNILKNTIFFSEPLAPFLSQNAQSMLDQTWFGPETTKRLLLTYPLALVFGEYPMQYGTMSPLILAFTPLAFFGLNKRAIIKRPVFQLAVSGIVCIILWVILRPSVFAPRYFLVPLLLFIPIVAAGTEYVYQLNKKNYLFNFTILFCIITLLFYNIYRDKVTVFKFINYNTGKIVESDFGHVYNAFNYINRNANIGERILLLTYSHYGLRSDLLLNASTEEEVKLLYTYPASKNYWESLYNNGFRYIIINKETHAAAQEKLNFNDIPSWLSITKVFDFEEYVIYNIKTNK